MYTPTNAYQRKFSSGLLLALLAFSGLLILVPLVSPVSAANATLPVISLNNNVIASGTTTPESLSVSNPSSNSYAITAFTVTAPSGWSFSSTVRTSPYFYCTATAASGNSLSSISCTTPTQAMPPGASGSVGSFSLTPSAPATTSASVGTFTSSIQDASSSAFYTGPTQKLWGTGSTPVVTITFPTGDSCTGGTYTAGTAACKPTASLTTTGNLGYVGVPVTWSTSTYGSVSPATAVTTSGTNAGVASTSFQPSDVVANGATTVTATLGTGPIASLASSVTTTASTPVKATFFLSAAAFPSSATHYIGGANNALSSAIGGTGPNDATLAGGTLAIAATDKFGNPIDLTTVGTLAVSVSTTAAEGVFYNAGNFTTITQASMTVTGGATSNAAFNDAYYQLGAYKSTDVLTGTISGTTPAFTVSGSSGALVTSTFAVASPVPTEFTGDCTSCAAGSSINLHGVPSVAQRGVPIIFFLDTATSTQVNGDGTMVVSTTTGVNGTGIAKFALDTGAGATLHYLTQLGDVSQTSGHLANSTDMVAAITTIAGPAASLRLKTFFDSALTLPATHAVNGSQLYVDITLADKYGNPTLNTFAYQIQIALSGPGSFSATNVYISSGCSDTAGVTSACASAFGPILWTAPNTFGAQTLSAKSTFPTATDTVTLVSATPTFAVTSPAPLNGVIYAGSTAVTFQGQANASLGYPSTTTIASVGYKIDSGTWQSVTVTPANKLNWVVSVFMTAGVHTITFNATDSVGNTVVSQAFTVLVDATAPDVNFVTVNNANISSPATLSANLVDTMGDVNASSVSAVATNLDTASTKTLTASVTGTNNPGHSVTYGVTLSGLTTGNWSVVLSASDYAGNSNSSTITVHVTVPFAQSFAVVGTPATSTLGQFAGITASYTNLNPTSQNVVIFAVFKNSQGQTMGIGTGSATFGAGATQSVFIADPVGLASGTYSVSIFVFTTGNLPVSVSTTISVTV